MREEDSSEIIDRRRLYTDEDENDLKSKINRILKRDIFDNKWTIDIRIIHDDKSCHNIMEELVIELDDFDGADLKDADEVVSIYNERLKANMLNIYYEKTKEGHIFL